MIDKNWQQWLHRQASSDKSRAMGLLRWLAFVAWRNHRVIFRCTSTLVCWWRDGSAASQTKARAKSNTKRVPWLRKSRKQLSNWSSSLIFPTLAFLWRCQRMIRWKPSLQVETSQVVVPKSARFHDTLDTLRPAKNSRIYVWRIIFFCQMPSRTYYSSMEIHSA